MNSWLTVILKYNSYISLLYLQIVFLIFWYLLAFYGFGLIKIKKNKIIFLIILEIILFLSIYLNYSFNSKQRALVRQESAIVYAGPGEEYHELKNLTQSSELEIMQKTGDWFKINYQNTNGWIKASNLTLL